MVKNYNIASAKNTQLISYNISRHPLEYYKNSSYAVSRYSKDTYDIEIKIIASGKKIDSIYSSLEEVYLLPLQSIKLIVIKIVMVV